MTEADLNKLWNAIPLAKPTQGRQALSGDVSVWDARPTIRHQLTVMADAGRIHRISRSMAPVWKVVGIRLAGSPGSMKVPLQAARSIG